MPRKPSNRPVKLSKNIDSINRPVSKPKPPAKRSVRKTEVFVSGGAVGRKRRKQHRDYDDVLDEFWL